ncbi:MAG: hypothetical protein V1729_03860 [Candidatus Woesearchaeota archaeon]
MSYAPGPINCYSAAASGRLDQVVNKFYMNVGAVNINNGNINHGIQHSIAAQRTGDIHVYNQTIDNRVGVQNNYVLNLDNRKIEFVSPYISDGSSRPQVSYSERPSAYLLSAPSGAYASSAPAYVNTITSGLLKSRRPHTQFIDSAEEIEVLVRHTFEKLTGKVFPDDIVIKVCSEEEMKKAHSANGGRWSPGIMGFAMNRHPLPSSIFVRRNNLDALMLTVGHEIGHVVAPRLPDALDEEAKAFAFELAWVKTIVENDIGGLADSFNPDFTPAANGLHDKAFAFVQNTVRKGKGAIDVFLGLAKGIFTTSYLA